MLISSSSWPGGILRSRNVSHCPKDNPTAIIIHVMVGVVIVVKIVH